MILVQPSSKFHSVFYLPCLRDVSKLYDCNDKQGLNLVREKLSMCKLFITVIIITVTIIIIINIIIIQNKK